MADAEDEKRPQFGNRFLTDSGKVFEHNAWDNVSWDAKQENEAKCKVEQNTRTKVSDELRYKYDAEADVFWDKFYSIHQNRFFKDRHWLFTEFPELAGSGGVPHSIPDRVKSQDNEPKGNNSQCTESQLQCERLCEQDKLLVTSEDISSKAEPLAGTVSDGSVNSCQLVSAPASSQGEPLAPDLGGCSVSNDQQVSAPDDPPGEPLAPTVGGDTSTKDQQVSGGTSPGRSGELRVLEVGCGVGNTVFPVLQTNNDPGLFVYACDLSSTAINILKEHPDYDSRRCQAFVCDITDPDSHLPFPANSLDVVVLIFILSAIQPEKMERAIQRLADCLKPGGLILLRDYGRHDLAQLRFKDGKCLGDNFYVRGDGTRVYFFTQEDLQGLFTSAGLVEEQNIVDRRLQVNRGRQLKMYRVWIQCKYRKPFLS